MILTEYNEIEHDVFLVEKGIEKGIEIANSNAISNMMHELSLTFEQAATVLKIPPVQYSVYRKAIENT